MSIFLPISHRKPLKNSKQLCRNNIVSKSTGIRSKIPQNDNDFFDLFPENLNLYMKSRSRLRNRTKTRQKNYYTNAALFSTIDRVNFLKKFWNLRIFSILVRFDLGIMIYLSKILVRILPRDPWLQRCSKNLARSCHDIQDASKRVNPGYNVIFHKILELQNTIRSQN